MMNIETISLEWDIIEQRKHELSVLDAVLTGEHAWTEENFLRRLPNKDRLSFMVLIDGSVAGFLIGTSYNGRAHINRLMVDREHQSKGVALHLLKRFLDACISLGFSEVTVETMRSSDAAMRFYETAGFVELKNDALSEYKELKGGRPADYALTYAVFGGDAEQLLSRMEETE
jgi:ribosomal protein S18 acetylase RimI-like enzyme